ncbi:choline/glycine/proline betaine transport protein [Halopolyspora algeriensis]|uniref:Choline/glycine/proline betaine transport protein n=1 Tax=Halopolyspora algeriensis TaxID=1500506 RepID=A0A368VJ60_9ACTN|nr:BCCT family transporter [Halopolyspora algeriensis]RCW40441.1 choline/glycine/proline betaine transport protein [Halopolyspora algeriensis]TQM53724.1 choline/glycine/proline betaine transport protein [Halopolyspora algeriensis]
MVQYLKTHTNPPVFVISALVTLAFVLWGVLAPANVATVAGAVNSFITTNFEWLYIIAASFFLIFVLLIMISRYGTIRLGPPDSTPEYGNTAWFAMLFTAGMGIGLVYYAVSEPVTHFLNPPVGEGGTREAVPQAMNLTFFHWGLHPWAIYIVLGLALGYFAFRKGLPLRPAAALYPLIGDRLYGWLGNTIDILAVFGTLFGLATSLGLGGQQVGAGLEALFGIPNTTFLQIVLILAITSIAVVSVMLGIDKGIRNLSLINLWLALALMVFVFGFASSRDLLNALAANIGTYLQNLPVTSFETYPGNNAAQEWQASWTLFYWGWWISWSPFVGMFIARISYGRTIRSFIAGALFAPVGASMVWLTVFGDAALRSLLRNPDNPLAEAGAETAMFSLLQQLPIPQALTVLSSVVVIVVVVLFFATSSDSGSLVVDILTNGGDPHPRWQQRLFWAVLEGVIAAILLAAGAVSGADALSALQAASIVAGLPFCIVLLVMCIGIWRGLASERGVLAGTREPSPLVAMRAETMRSRGSSSTRTDVAEREAETGSTESAEEDTGSPPQR